MQIKQIRILAALSCVAFALPSLAEADGPGSPGAVSIGPNKDGHSVVSLTVTLAEGGELSATFDFGETKGFLGPGSNPSDQSGFVNTDKTLIAVNHQPATKSSYAHFFLRSLDGDVTFLNNVNGRIAKLLKGRWGKEANNFLRVESITGRKVALQVVDFGGKGGKYEQYTFSVRVNPKGGISLAK